MGTFWSDAIDIVNRNFPEAAKKGIFPNNGSTPTKRTKIDLSRTKKVFGIKLLSYEDQVKSMVKQYLTHVDEPIA
jgi:hypothetical protein